VEDDTCVERDWRSESRAISEASSQPIVRDPSEDPAYAALKATPPTEIRPTQNHVPASTTIGTVPIPKGIPVLDRNGKPTGEMKYDTRVPFEMTLERLGHIRGLLERDVRKESADAIRSLQQQLDLTRADREKMRIERDDLAANARTYDRAGREDKIQERIRVACETHAATLQNEIRALRAEVGTLKSENADLREAKRRLKAARQGSR
jgi:hypothetical protein